MLNILKMDVAIKLKVIEAYLTTIIHYECGFCIAEVLKKVKASNKPKSSSIAGGSDNFTPWTEFSPCDQESGFKFRTRKCLSKVEEKCKGKLVEAVSCGKPSRSKPKSNYYFFLF